MRLLPVFVLCFAVSAEAQHVSVLDPWDDYTRVVQLREGCPAGSRLIRPMRQTADCEADHPWTGIQESYAPARRFRIYDPVLITAWNSHRPYGRNTGVLWQGRGGSTVFSAGGHAGVGPLSVSIRPNIYLAQNASFELSPRATPAGMSAFAYPLMNGSHYIDLPQRYGKAGRAGVDWGQSFVRLDVWKAGAGLSTENMWWGPGMRNGIVMSSNSAGFPHLFLEAAEPVGVGIGSVEGRWIWGRLAESEFFDEDPSNDRRFITGIVGVFTPRWVENLHLGVTRTLVKVWREPLSARDLFAVTDGLLKVNSRMQEGGTDEFDQMASVFGRWVFTENGVEIYAEWARGDHAWDLWDFAMEPEHGHGYTLGLQKATELTNDRVLRTFAEVTNLKAGRTTSVRSGRTASFFYVHSTVRQGYTHDGRVIGAGIGPGADGQSIGVDLFAPWGNIGALAERVQWNGDFYQIVSDDRFGHMVELSLGVHGRLFHRGFEIGAGLTFIRILNEYYVRDDDVSNVHLSVSVRRILGLR